MAAHPLNLALRFGLELAALWGMGVWGWTQHQGAARWLLTLGIPLLAAAAWGIFRVPNDPGVPPVQVPGLVRLALEAVFFGGAVVLLFLAHQRTPALILGALVLLHYIVAVERVAWLLTQ